MVCLWIEGVPWEPGAVALPLFSYLLLQFLVFLKSQLLFQDTPSSPSADGPWHRSRTQSYVPWETVPDSPWVPALLQIFGLTSAGGEWGSWSTPRAVWKIWWPRLSMHLWLPKAGHHGERPVYGFKVGQGPVTRAAV